MTTKVAKTAVEAAEPVLEAVAEVVDESVDTVARIPKLRLNGTTRGQQMVILGVAFAVGAAAGGAGAYFWTRKKLRTEYEQLLESETEHIRNYYRVKRVKRDQVDGLITGEEQEKDVEPIFEPQGNPAHTDYTAFSKTPEELSKVKEKPVEEELEAPPGMQKVGYNIFTDSAPVGPFDIEEQDTAKPHVISREDFLTGMDGYDQANLTYFVREDILADEMDQPVDDNDKLVGQENLRRFGHGSGDNNTVFVRNPRNKMEYQIIRSTGSFGQEVHAFDDESDAQLRHSDRRPRRMRPGDD